MCAITAHQSFEITGSRLQCSLCADSGCTKYWEIIADNLKAGYDFVHYGEARGRGQREIPQDFSPDAVTRATDATLNRLKTLTGKKFRKFFR